MPRFPVLTGDIVAELRLVRALFLMRVGGYTDLSPYRGGDSIPAVISATASKAAATATTAQQFDPEQQLQNSAKVRMLDFAEQQIQRLIRRALGSIENDSVAAEVLTAPIVVTSTVKGKVHES